MSEEIDSQVRDLDAAIAACDPIAENTIAWRLFDSPLIHAHRDRLVGTVLSDRGFVDLTCLEDAARKYVQGAHPVLAEVLLSIGTRVMALFEENGSDECDLLLARDSRFLVNSVGEQENNAILSITLVVLE